MNIKSNPLLKEAFAQATAHYEIIKYRLGWPPSELAQNALKEEGYKIGFTYDPAQEMRDIGEEEIPGIEAPFSDEIQIRTARGEIIDRIAEPDRRKNTFRDVRNIIADAYRHS